MNERPLRRLLLASLAVLALVATACGGAEDDDAPDGDAAPEEDEGPEEDDGEETPEPPAELTPVTLRLNFVADASAAPFYYAVDQGWYEDAGLDVAIEAGQGSLVTSQTVGGGDDEFGYVTADAAIRAISQGAELDVAAVLQRQSNMTVVHHPESTVESIDDLFDLQIFTAEVLPQPSVLRGLVASQGGDPEALDIVNSDIPAWGGLYEQTENGAVLGRIGLQDVRFKAIDDVQVVTYTELGLEDFLGNTLIVNDTFAAENPELTSGFVQATVRAFEAAMEDPEPVMDAIVAALPDLGDRDLASQELDGTLSVTPGQGADGMEIVPTEAAWFADMIAFMEEHMGLEGALPPEEYFTNDYLA